MPSWFTSNRYGKQFRKRLVAEGPTKAGQNGTKNGILFSRSCEKPMGIPSNDQQNCSTDGKQICNIFLNPYSLRDMDPAAPISLHHTPHGDPISHQYPQTATHQQRKDLCPMFSSLQPMDREKKGLHVSLAVFQENYFPHGRVNGSFATVEDRKSGAMDGVPPIVLNYSCC